MMPLTPPPRPSTPHKIGDLVRVKTGNPDEVYEGQIATVQSDLIFGRVVWTDGRERWVYVHLVDLPLPAVLPTNIGCPAGICYEPHHLVPIGGDFTPGSWRALKEIWQPPVKATAEEEG